MELHDLVVMFSQLVKRISPVIGSWAMLRVHYCAQQVGRYMVWRPPFMPLAQRDRQPSFDP